MYERDRAADQRDQLADQRDQVADDRECVADQREQQLAAWEHQLDQREHRLGITAASTQDRAREAIARSRALLAASTARLDRSEAALRRASDSQAREQDAINREVAGSAHVWATAHDDPSTTSMLADSAERLRKQLVTAAHELAKAEDLVAHHHERLARNHPDTADHNHRQANAALATAQLARETAQRFSY